MALPLTASGASAFRGVSGSRSAISFLDDAKMILCRIFDNLFVALVFSAPSFAD